MEYTRLQDANWQYTGSKYANMAQTKSGYSGTAVHDYIMSLNEEDRGPTYTRLAITNWAVPSGSGMMNGDYWANKGKELANNPFIYTAIMDADE